MRKGLSSRWKTIKLTPAPNYPLTVDNDIIIDKNENIIDNNRRESKGYIGLPHQDKVYPGQYPQDNNNSHNNSNSNNNKLSIAVPGSPEFIQQQQQHKQHEGEKQAGDSFDLDELFDLNGETFWRDWEAAGGDPDEYFKETLPNYGLVSTLFMTISIPSSIYPPSFNFQQHPPSKHLIFVSLYVVFMCLTTTTSLISTLLAIGIHQQYVNAYSKPLRVDFASKYGYLVGVLTSLLVIGAMSLWGAMVCVFIVTYNEIAAYIGSAIMFFGGWGAIYAYSSMTKWNANNYSKQMVIDLKFRRQKAKFKNVIQNIRQNSKPTLFNMPQDTISNNIPQLQSLSPNIHSISSPPNDSSYQYNLSSHLTPSSNVGDLSLTSIYSTSSKFPDEIIYNPSSRRTSKPNIPQFSAPIMEISRIKEENDAMLAGIDNTPLQYGNHNPIETE